jgi:hypothetical protein
VLQVLNLVACSRAKLGMISPAQDLYCSAWFRLVRLVVQHEPWAILSAKHGVVMPMRLIEPYDVTLNGQPKAARQAWAVGVLATVPIAERYRIWGGRDYFEFLAGPLRAELPLKGLGIGQQLSRLIKLRPVTPFEACEMSADLLRRCDPESLPKYIPPATDEDWDIVAGVLDSTITIERERGAR